MGAAEPANGGLNSDTGDLAAELRISANAWAAAERIGAGAACMGGAGLGWVTGGSCRTGGAA
jgi:hypothetical protein